MILVIDQVFPHDPTKERAWKVIGVEARLIGGGKREKFETWERPRMQLNAIVSTSCVTLYVGLDTDEGSLRRTQKDADGRATFHFQHEKS